MSKLHLACSISGFGSKQIEKLQLENGQQVMVRRALLCFEGEHMGMYGPVKVSQDMISVMVDRFNREYERPKNENDYPPLTKDHNACADNTMGRLIGPLAAEMFENPRTGETVLGLFGNVRVDDEDAQLNVMKGKYAHLSISFDDDMDNLGEIFEVSFVGVEAARGAMILSHKGEKMSLEEMKAKLAKTEGSVKSLQRMRKDTKLAIKSAVVSLQANIDSMVKETTDNRKVLAGQIKSLKTSVVKAQFSGFVRKGKLSKAEYDKVDFEQIAQMDSASQKVLLAAYQNRPVSADAFQHGTAGAEPLDGKSKKKLSAADTRKLIKAQREGKRVNLMKDDEKKDDEGDEVVIDLNNPEGVDPDKTPEVTGLTMEEIEDAMSKLEGLGGYMTKIDEMVEKLKGISASLMGETEDDKED